MRARAGRREAGRGGFNELPRIEAGEAKEEKASTGLIRACNSASIKISSNLKSSEDPRSLVCTIASRRADPRART